MRGIVALLCGMLFGTGLAVSGMTDTAKVLGFLDIFGAWVPDLAFVMGAAVCVTLVAFYFIRKMERPLLSARFFFPGKTIIDGRVLTGAAIFGVGWGVYGYCPGPALSAMVYLDSKTFIFVVAMLVGMALANKVGRA